MRGKSLVLLMPLILLFYIVDGQSITPTRINSLSLRNLSATNMSVGSLTINGTQYSPFNIYDVVVRDNFNLSVNYAIGSDLLGNGSDILPYRSVTKALSVAQYPLRITLNGQVFTDVLNLGSSNSNINIISPSVSGGQQTLMYGGHTTNSGFTRMRISGVGFTSTTLALFSFNDDMRHTFENCSFSGGAKVPFYFSSAVKNWINFLRCDFSGLTEGALTLPAVTNGAIIRIYDCGVVNLSIGSGWSVYYGGDTQLNVLSKSSSAVIVDLKEVRCNNIVGSQDVLSAIDSVVGNTLDGVYALNFSNPAVGGLSASCGDIVFKYGNMWGVLHRWVDAPASISSMDGGVETGTTYVKGLTGWVNPSVVAQSSGGGAYYQLTNATVSMTSGGYVYSYTAPSSDIYQLSYSIKSDNSYSGATLYVNGVSYDRFGVVASGGAVYSAVIPLNIGDVVSVQLFGRYGLPVVLGKGSYCIIKK